MIACPTVTKRAIRGHYDVTTPFYRLLWGLHIHHGMWEGDEPPAAAQRRLIDHLANAADIETGEAVLDVGCGMGGSAIHLARTRACAVTGVTISRLQRWWAGAAATIRGVGGHTRFVCRDVESFSFRSDSFDVIWSVECTEHLFDKPAFFRRAADWLRPGGRVAICAWLAGTEPHSPAAHALVEQVCDRFLCPSLGTMADYRAWMRAAGLTVKTATDLTARVSRTWEVCIRRVRRSGMHQLSRLVGSNPAKFVAGFQTLLEGYRSGAMRYGCFVAAKPTSE